MLIFTHNKIRLKRHFEKDKVLFAYHLGDLDDFYFQDCQWAVDFNDTAKIHEAVLIYNAGDIPTVLAFGLTELFERLIQQIVPILPVKFYAHFQNENRKFILENYNETSLGTFHKMKLENFQKKHDDSDTKIRQLTLEDFDILLDLYSRAYPENYFNKRMLETNRYYGYFENDKLIAVSGIHVDSDEYNISTLGNITTDLDYRGKGIATKVTSKLVEALQTNPEKTICLNVKADNQSAIASYTKLGFVKVHEYQESMFKLK